METCKRLPGAKRLTGRQRGETLIEAVMAMFVVTFGAAGLLQMNISSVQGLALSSHNTAATTLATNKLHDLLLLPPTSTQLVSGNDTNNLGPDGTAYTASGAAIGAYNATAADGTFSRSWTVQDSTVGGAAHNNFKLITVDVSWYETNPKPHRSHVQAVGGMPE